MFAGIKQACAEVAARAQHVKLEATDLKTYAATLQMEALEPLSYDADHHFLGSPEDTLAYLLTLDAINFGSGYFPHLQKRPGLSGYCTVALSLKERFEQNGPFSPQVLLELSPQDCAALFRQPPGNEVRDDLMRLFARALNDLGKWVLERYAGEFVNVIEAAGGSAEKLALTLAEMPFFQDVAVYRGASVPLYKRA